MTLFKKVAVLTDLHVGGKSNGQNHLNDCEEYVDWFISMAKKHGCDTGISMGDWHNNRNNINLVTLDTSIRLLEKLGSAFDQFIWFPGNHDLFYKDRRDVHSSIFARHIPGVTVINKLTTLDGVTIVPWLVGDEWKQIAKCKSQYMFGHFELPEFFMNGQIVMPDHGQLKTEHFIKQELVFSGHFHKRQNRKNIWYIGNAFPHNYGDAGDDERGMMILAWGGKPEFYSWPDAPKYRKLKLSELIDGKDKIMKNKMYLRVDMDIDVSYEEANFLKETFMSEYDIREFSLVPANTDIETDSNQDIITNFDSVDTVITRELLNIDSDSIDRDLLLDIYKNLE
jgi:hypothetical protein